MNLNAELKQRLDLLCERFGAAKLRMFGSAAEGRERADGDVDLPLEKLEFTRGRAPSAFELVDPRDALSQVIDVRAVDLAFKSILDNPYGRRAIEPQLRAPYPVPAA